MQKTFKRNADSTENMECHFVIEIIYDSQRRHQDFKSVCVWGGGGGGGGVGSKIWS